VNEQKQQANYLAGDDDKMRVAAANKLRRKPNAAAAFEQGQRNQNAFEQQSRNRNTILDKKQGGFPK
jgi:hypothetical protein